MPRTTSGEHDFIRKIRVEGGVIDLTNNRRELGHAHCRRKLVVKAARDLYLEPTLRSLDHLQCIPARRATLIDDDFLVAKVLEGAIFLGGVICEIPLRDASGEDCNTHDLKCWLLSEFLFQIDIDPQGQRAHLDHFSRKTRVDSLFEPVNRQFAFHQEQPWQSDIAMQQMQ